MTSGKKGTARTPAEHAAWYKDWRAGPGKVLSRNWYLKQKGTVIGWWRKARSKAQSRGLLWQLSLTQFVVLRNGPCHYCGSPGPVGIDRADSSLGYLPDNCVPCCFYCNAAKNIMSTEEFKEWIAKVHDYFVLGNKPPIITVEEPEALYTLVL